MAAEFIKISFPNPTGGAGIGVGPALPGARQGTRNLNRFQKIVTEKDYSEVTKRIPQIVRFGESGYEEQINDRSEITQDGVKVRWGVPSYDTGDSLPPEAQKREQVIWDAALGGPGGFQSHGKDWAEWGINDADVKARSTALGNQLPVPASVSYAAFVTGGIAVQDNKLPRYAIAAKPAKTKRKYKDDRFNKAMYWFLRLTYGYRMKSSELTRGLFTPRKRLSVNPKVMKQITGALAEFITSPRSGAGGPVAGRVYPGAGR